MKYFSTLLLNLVLISLLQGQSSLSEKIASYACESLDSIENYDDLQDSIRPKITEAMARLMMEGSSEEKSILGTVEGIQSLTKKALETLPNNCPNVRRLIIKQKKDKFYDRSANAAANKHFDKGNDYLERGEFKKAKKEFKSAIKLDENFVYAIDHLAITYRQRDKYKSAIKYYKKSLDIFPEGNLALLNLAVVYSLKGDNANSIKYFEKLKFYHPENPEGYFGLAKMLFFTGDYEGSIDNLFRAHRIYLDTNSKYKKDSKLLMGIIIDHLRKIEKDDFIEKKAEEYNITIED